MQKIKRKIYGKKNLLLRLGALTLTILLTALLLSQVAFARTTYVITDGDTVLVHTTYATDPAAVLTEAGLTLGEEDTFTAQADSAVAEIEITVTRLQYVRVHMDGQILATETYGTTVAGILNQLDIPAAGIRVVPEPDTLTTDGMIIRVIRVEEKQESYVMEEPFGTVYCVDESLKPEEEKVLCEGIAGTSMYTDLVTYEDGVEVSREHLNKQPLIAPVDRIIVQGVDRANKKQEGSRRVYSSILDTLGFNSTQSPGQGGAIVADNGKQITTASGEVISYKRKMAVEATAYSCENWKGGKGVTAMGTRARYGAIAVDPRYIPYGTEMYIVSNDGQYIYGYATAEDCGNFRGYAIDLYFDTEDECWIFGRRACTVYILG